MIYILYNLFSGNGDAAEEAEMLSVLYYGEEICSADIRSIASWGKLFSMLDDDDTLIICGGDGTLHRFVNDTDGIDIPCNILYHATGTNNDFLHDLGGTVGDNPVLIKEHLRHLPYAYVNGKKYRFLNGISFKADLCARSDAAPISITVTADGKRYAYEKVWFAASMKGRFYGGGMMPTPNGDRTDPEGKVSLTVLHGSDKLKALALFPLVFKGKSLRHSETVSIHTGHDIRVTFDRPTSLLIDGEAISDVTEYGVHSHIF